MNAQNFLRRSLCFAALSLLAVACATTPTTDTSSTQPAYPEAPPAVESLKDIRVTYQQQTGRLGNTVRAIGQQHPGLVLMAGLENREAGRAKFAHATMDEVARALAKSTDCAVQSTPNYHYLFAPGYEVLRDLSLMNRLHPRYNAVRARIAFGHGTELYTLLKLLSQGVDITVVADNAVAAAQSGEIALGEIPLQESLEAVLKSARVTGVEVVSTEDYIFLYSKGRPLPHANLLQGDTLDDYARDFLESRVSVYLPEPPADRQRLDIEEGARPLGEILESLSAQLGVTVVAEAAIKRIPVNPVALNNVTVAQAMDLIIWQWLASDFGYQLTSDRLVIRQRQRGEEAPIHE
jgi:hypothetical protein